jgi:hypothetical protein
MKRRIMLLGCVVAVAVVVVAPKVAPWCAKSCPVDVSPETRARLKHGMSRSEVESILGGAAGDYRSRPDVRYSAVLSGGRLRTYETLEERYGQVTRSAWYTDEYMISVCFSSDGKVVLIQGCGASSPPPSASYPSPLREILHPLIDP